MILGVVGEYGANGSRYPQLLADIWDRRRQVNTDERPFARVGDEPHVAVTFGNTDLVEVSFTHGYFPFADFSASGAEAFRRATGMVVPEPSDLTAWSDSENTPMSERVVGGPALFDLPNDSYPFFGVVYARMSLLARLCSPPCPRGRVPAQRALARMMARDSRLWDRLDRFTPSVSDHALAICPCVGLDELEVVLLVRSSSMDALAGLGWALRRTSLEEALPSCPASLARLTTLVGEEASSVEAWNKSPVLANTRTLLGALLEDAQPGDERAIQRPDDTPPPKEPPGSPMAWRLPPPPAGLASSGAVFVTNYKYAAGYEEEGLRQIRRAIGLAEQTEPARADLLYVFGHWQGLAMGRREGPPLKQKPGPETEADQAKRRDWAYRHPPKKRTTAEVYERLARLAGGGQGDTRPGIGTVTSAGVEGALDAGTPLESKLLRALEERLVRARTGLIRRQDNGAPRKGRWLKRWLEGARAGVVNYPLTSGVRNVMLTAFSMLEDRPEPAIDTLPTLAFLVKCADNLDAQRRAPASERAVQRLRTPRSPDELWRPAELYYVYRTAADYLTVTGRQGSALRPPGTDLSFEKSAGVTVPRDAFQAFASGLADDLGLADLPLLVVDGADGWPHVETIPGGPARVSISSLALPEPLHWTYGHEVGHISFLKVRLKDARVAPGLSETWTNLQLVIAPHEPPRTEETLDETLRRVARELRIREMSGPNDATLLNSFADVMTEVPADLVAFHALRDPKVPADKEGSHSWSEAHHARFWFTAGPGLTLAVQHQNGQEPPDPRTTLPLLLRVYLLSRLLDGEVSRVSRKDFARTLRHVTDSSDSGSLCSADPAVLRLLALREDLNIDWRSWDVSTDLSIDELMRWNDDDTRWIMEVVQRWLDLCEAMLLSWNVACGALRKERTAHTWDENEKLDDSARDLYVKALDQVIALADEATSGAGTPWLPPRCRGDVSSPALASGRDSSALGLSPRGGIMPAPKQDDFAKGYASCVTRLLLALADRTRAHRLGPLDEHVLLTLGEPGSAVT